MLCVHPNTLRRWSDSNLLRSFRIGPRRDRRFLRQDVEERLAGAPESNGALRG